MLRLIVIGKTEQDATMSANWLVAGQTGASGFEKKYEIGGRTAIVQALPCFVDQKTAKPIGTGVAFVARNAGDLQAMDQLVQHYNKVPIKFVLYDGAAEDSSFENDIGARGLIKGNPENFVEELIKANNEIVKLIAAVFKGFDKDHSGFIELAEIKALAKELGVEIPEAEAIQIIKELDTNNDGKISMEEFVEWWKSGRQGRAHTMNEVVAGFVKKNKLLSSAADALAKIVGMGEELKEEEAKLATSNFGIFVNRPKAAGLLFEFALMTKGKALNSEFQLFSSAIGLPPNEPFFGIAFGSKNPKAASESLKGIVEPLFMMASSMIPNAEQIMPMIDHKYGETSNKVVFCLCPSEAAKPMIEGIMQVFKPFTGFILPEQLLQIYLGFATDLKKIALESKPVYELLMEGLSLEFKCQTSHKLDQSIIQLLKDPQIKEAMPNDLRHMIGNVVHTAEWCEGVKGELEFEIDEELKNMIAEKGAETPFAMPVKDLKAMQIPMVKEALGQVPLAEGAHKFFKEEVTSIEFFIYLSNILAVKFSVDLPGLEELLNLD